MLIVNAANAEREEGPTFVGKIRGTVSVTGSIIEVNGGKALSYGYKIFHD